MDKNRRSPEPSQVSEGWTRSTPRPVAPRPGISASSTGWLQVAIARNLFGNARGRPRKREGPLAECDPPGPAPS